MYERFGRKEGDSYPEEREGHMAFAMRTETRLCRQARSCSSKPLSIYRPSPPTLAPSSHNPQPHALPVHHQLARGLLLADPLTPDQLGEVQPNLPQHARMLLRQLQAAVPRVAVPLHAAELPPQDDVEAVDVLLG